MQPDAYDLVTQRLAKVTGYAARNGHGDWRCPAHGDTNPSLSVVHGDGKVVLCCHAGCSVNDICGALGLVLGDLFDRPAEKSNGHRQIVATYDYTDEAGDLLFQKVRYTPKQFAQRRPDGTGGWIWKLGGTRQPLYNLPALLEAVKVGATIFVAEGEKDSDALTRVGETATCNPGGAGKWRPEHTDTMAGASEVVIVADRDGPGYRHAREVARALEDKVGNLLVVQALEGKDAADHLAAGHGVDQFKILTVAELDQLCADDGPIPEDSGSDLADWIAPIDWPTFWSAEPPDVDWAIEPLVPAGRQVALYSSAKIGKSLILLDSSAARATGRPYFGQPAAEPIHIIYIDMEMTEDDLRERLTDLGYGPDIDLGRLHYYQLCDLPPLDTELGGQVIEAIVRRYEAKLVVLDTMARVVNGEENQADTYRHFYRYTGRRLKALGVALARLDHGGKEITRGQRGSSAKAEDIDVVWRLTADGQCLTLGRTHSRVPWVAHQVVLQREEEPTLRHVLAPAMWPADTAEVARRLDDLGVPLDASSRQAKEALKRAGCGKRLQVILAALKYRRARP